jgi:hypothetical protein
MELTKAEIERINSHAKTILRVAQEIAALPPIVVDDGSAARIEELENECGYLRQENERLQCRVNELEADGENATVQS